MPTVVVTSPELLDLFAQPTFFGTQLDVSLATAQEAVLAQCRRPSDVALLHLGGSELDVLGLARQLHTEPGCDQTRDVIVVPATVDASTLDAVHAALPRGLAVWPCSADELYDILAEQVLLPRRAPRRASADLGVVVELGGTRIETVVCEASVEELRIALPRPIDVGSALTLDFGAHISGQSKTAARIQSIEPRVGGALAGLVLLSPRPEVRGLQAQLALWDVRPGGRDGSLLVTLQGEIDENTTFQGLLARIGGAPDIVFDLHDVSRMNSAGVRQWCGLVAALGASRLTFRRCSLALTIQLSMVPSAVGHAEIASVLGPYACVSCAHEAVRLLPTPVIRSQPALEAPSFPCACGGRLDFDDLPERFFAFLR